MNGVTTKHLIETQIPYHIREANPLFTKFLEYYYEFVENSKINDIIQEIKTYNNIDDVEQAFLEDFFEEFRRLPKNILADKRLVAKHIYDLYKAKGSTDGLKLLFRLVYDENINISYPSDSILRASDGRWIQDSIITVEDISGAFLPSVNRIRFSNSQGEFDFLIKSVETIVPGEHRIYFETRRTFFVETDQIVNVYTNDTLNYVGKAILMPSTIQIEEGGAYWQVGQVIVLPGDVKDTICQIKRVGTNGSIRELAIVQYGYGYDSDEVFIITPFQYKPESSYTEIYSEKITDIPLSFAHTVNIFEFTDGIGESILGLDSNQDYVLEGYVIQDYINKKSIAETVFSDTTSDVLNDEITIQQWVESRTRLRIRNSKFAKTAGYYQDFRGMPSAPDIRLQDNFFYQIFSYVIDTAQIISDYATVIDIVHPAGIKYFSNLVKSTEIAASVSVDRILSREFLFLSDTAQAYEDPDTAFGKGFSARQEDFIKATDLAVENNYDANNELEFYDPAIDWDEIVSVPFSADYDAENYDAAEYNQIFNNEYDLENYESENYDETSGPYTQEDPNIDIQLN